MNHQTSFGIFLKKHLYLPPLSLAMLLIAFVFGEFLSLTSSAEKAAGILQQQVIKFEKQTDKLLTDKIFIEKLFDKNFTDADLLQLSKNNFFTFVYAHHSFENELIFWSTSIIVPDEKLISQNLNEGFIELENGSYIFINKIISSPKTKNNFQIIFLLPVQYKYAMQADFLKNQFTANKNFNHYFEIASNGKGMAIRSHSGKILYNIQNKNVSFTIKDNTGVVIFRLLAVLFLFFFIHSIASWLSVYKSLAHGLIFLIAILAALRLYSYYVPYPINFRQWELFDPSVYGASFIHRSLGDLMMNVMLTLWVLLFYMNRQQKLILPLWTQRGSISLILGSIISFAIVFSTFFTGDIIKSLVNDSEISFDVTNFFSLNAYSFVGFIVLCSIAIVYFFIVQNLFAILKRVLQKHNIKIFLLLIFCSLALLTLRIPFEHQIEFFLVGWMFLFLWLLLQNNLQINLKHLKSSTLLFWMFLFSVSMSLLLIIYNNNKELRERKRIAEKLSIQTDPSIENLISIGLSDFINNNFLYRNFDRLRFEASSRILKDSLINSNFSGYLNKFYTKLYFYNNDFSSLHNIDSTAYNTLNSIYFFESKNTSVAGLRSYESDADKLTYLYRKEIKDTGVQKKSLGYLFVQATPKKYKSQTLLPDLFTKTAFQQLEHSTLFAYAVYNNGDLISNYNDYPFAVRLSKEAIPKNEFEVKQTKNGKELWYRATAEKLIVVVRKANTFIDAVTLFAYLFCSFLLITALAQGLRFISETRLQNMRMKQYLQFNIRSQVHGTIIFISLFSFIVIGVSTISFFINRYKQNNIEKLSHTIQMVASEVRSEIVQQSIFDDVLKVYDKVSNKDLEQRFEKISEIHNADINLYDLSGRLQITTNKIVYSKGLISNQMDPIAYYHLTKLKKVQHVQNEKLGSKTYLSFYIPVRDNEGTVYAYLNIPSFLQQNELNQEISNFLITIINLNAFIFLIAGLIALLVTNRITHSFSIIAGKMKRINLEKHNEPIVWNRNDEIGILVAEYNKMLSKLENSVTQLARSEREGAWREMAKQVAHEIKNPLTPMKLSIQYLQKAIRQDSPQVQEITEKVAGTLIEQIDHLSKIAADFSQFANIGNIQNEKLNIVEQLKAAVALHQTGSDDEIIFSVPDKVIFVYADKTNLNRMFTNLMQNALQSVPNSRKAKIEITLIEHLSTVEIKIKDNGDGIPQEIQSKIFTPNFTTKSSGTGLGLAMCKGIIEQLKGEIHFKTQQNVGTVFTVVIPTLN